MFFVANQKVDLVGEQVPFFRDNLYVPLIAALILDTFRMSLAKQEDLMIRLMMTLTRKRKMLMLLMRKRMMSLLPALPVSVSCWLTNGRVMLLGTPVHPDDVDEDNEHLDDDVADGDGDLYDGIAVYL